MALSVRLSSLVKSRPAGCVTIARARLKYLHTFNFEITTSGSGDRGSTVVKVLCYKSEGRWFDPR